MYQYCKSCGIKYPAQNQAYAGSQGLCPSCRNKDMLILPIKKKWFDMIASGEKTEEYREIKPYWEIRFQNAFFKKYNHCVNWEEYPINVIFRNGYGENKPQIHAMVTIGKGTGRPEWGAEAEREYYVLKIHELW